MCSHGGVLRMEAMLVTELRTSVDQEAFPIHPAPAEDRVYLKIWCVLQRKKNRKNCCVFGVFYKEKMLQPHGFSKQKKDSASQDERTFRECTFKQGHLRCRSVPVLKSKGIRDPVDRLYSTLGTLMYLRCFQKKAVIPSPIFAWKLFGTQLFCVAFLAQHAQLASSSDLLVAALDFQTALWKVWKLTTNSAKTHTKNHCCTSK